MRLQGHRTSNTWGVYAGTSLSAASKFTSWSFAAILRASSHAYHLSVRVCFIDRIVRRTWNTQNKPIFEALWAVPMHVQDGITKEIRTVLSLALIPESLPASTLFNSCFSVASRLRSLQQTHHRACRSSHDLFRSS